MSGDVLSTPRANLKLSGQPPFRPAWSTEYPKYSVSTANFPALIVQNRSKHDILMYYLFTHGAESFLRIEPVLSYFRNSPYFMEHDGSLLHSQPHVPILSQIDPVHHTPPTS